MNEYCSPCRFCHYDLQQLVKMDDEVETRVSSKTHFLYKSFRLPTHVALSKAALRVLFSGLALRCCIELNVWTKICSMSALFRFSATEAFQIRFTGAKLITKQVKIPLNSSSMMARQKQRTCRPTTQNCMRKQSHVRGPFSYCHSCQRLDPRKHIQAAFS